MTTVTTNSELYHTNTSGSGYDALNRLTDFQRGTLSSGHDSISGTAGETQDWTLDVLGNWKSLTTNGGTPVTRSANARNEYTNVGGNTPTYDHNGNLTKDENGQQYVYDAWNRLKQVKNSSGTVIITYTYDALGRRIVESPASGTATDVYFNGNNVIEERQSGATTAQYVWGLGYVNDLIERDRNADANGSTGSYGKSGSGLEERLFAQQDGNFNVTSIVDTSGNIVERFAYDAYGAKVVLDVNWTSTTDSKGWIYSFQGGRQDPISGLVHFGRPGRDYSTSLGRWTEPDGGYWDGANVYQVERSGPVDRIDPSGLRTVTIWIYVDPSGLPRTFNPTAVGNKLNAMVHKACKCMASGNYQIRVAAKDRKPTPAGGLGTQWNKPGGSYNTSLWDWVPVVNWFTAGYRAATKQPQGYIGWVFNNPSLPFGAHTDGPQTEINWSLLTQGTAAWGFSSQSGRFDWTQAWANYIGHEQLYLGLLGGHDHGTPGDIVSGKPYADGPAVITDEFCKALEKELEMGPYD